MIVEQAKTRRTGNSNKAQTLMKLDKYLKTLSKNCLTTH